MVKEYTMKQTEIGLIPEEWEIKSVAELINENSIISHLDGNHGALYPKSNEFIEDGVAYIGANTLINNKIDYGKAKYLSAKRADTFIKGVAKAGDVLFAHNATVGPVGLVDNSYDKIILSTTLTYYRTDNSKLLNKYLLYEFQTDRFIRQYSSVMSQSTRNQVPISPQRKFVLCVPPLPEQEAIAEALSDADAWLESLEQLIAKKRLIKQGAMQELLTPKEDWEVKNIKEITNNIIDYRGVTPKKLGMEWGNGSIVALSAGNVKKGFIDFNSDCYYASEELYKRWMKNGNPKKNDIVFTLEAPLGNVALLPNNDKYILSQRTILLQLSEKFNPRFIFQILLSVKFQNYILESATGSTAQGIKRQVFEKLLVTVPKSLAEQTRIATILSDMDAELEALEGQLGKARQVKQGMMQELLTGRVRLV